MKRTLSILALYLFSFSILSAQEERGAYFHRKEYFPAPLPSYQESKAQLPSPVWDENPGWVELYWRAWEIAFSNLQ